MALIFTINFYTDCKVTLIAHRSVSNRQCLAEEVLTQCRVYDPSHKRQRSLPNPLGLITACLWASKKRRDFKLDNKSGSGCGRAMVLILKVLLYWHYLLFKICFN